MIPDLLSHLKNNQRLIMNSKLLTISFLAFFLLVGLSNLYGQNPVPVHVRDFGVSVNVRHSVNGQLAEPDREGCAQEWADAYTECGLHMGDPAWSKITGGHTDLYNCARGLVSVRCGGNRLE